MKILFLSSWFPYPPTNGAKIRIYNLIRELAVDHEITLLAFTRWTSVEEARLYVPYLEQFCSAVDVVAAPQFNGSSMAAIGGYFSRRPRSVVQTFSPEMEQLIQKHLDSENYNVAVASEVGPPGPTSLLATRINDLPIILDALELAITKDVYQNEKSLIPRLRRGLTWMKLKKFAKATILQSSACTVPSLQEQLNLVEIAPQFSPIEVIPHSLDLKRYDKIHEIRNPNSIVFTGSFDFSLNQDAAYFFLNEIYPTLKEDHPNVSLQIVGSTNGVNLDEWPLDNSVTFTGFKRDVRSIVARSWLSVVPLRYGSGTRLKIIESMALGTPVVSTSKGAEGLDVSHGENILIADTPGAFAKNIIDVIRNPNLHDQLSKGGRDLVSERYSAEAMGKKFNSLLDRIL